MGVILTGVIIRIKKRLALISRRSMISLKRIGKVLIMGALFHVSMAID